MNNFNMCLTLVKAVELFEKSGLQCLRDERFTALYLPEGIQKSLESFGIFPVAKDTNANCELYSTKDIPVVFDIYGPMYLEYLKQSYEKVSDRLVDRADQQDKLSK